MRRTITAVTAVLGVILGLLLASPAGAASAVSPQGVTVAYTVGATGTVSLGGSAVPIVGGSINDDGTGVVLVEFGGSQVGLNLTNTVVTPTSLTATASLFSWSFSTEPGHPLTSAAGALLFSGDMVDPAQSPPLTASVTNMQLYQNGPLTFSSGAFPNTAPNVATSLTVTVTNHGNPATPTAITATGAGVAVASGGTCAVGTEIPIHPGTCTVNLTWTPTVPGALTGASLTIAYPGGASATNALTLTGTAGGAPQTPVNNCVKTGSGKSLPAKLMKAGCVTNAGQIVGVGINAQFTRGDLRLYTLYCQTSNGRIFKTRSTGYGDGSRYCAKGDLKIVTNGSHLRVRVDWFAPATDAFAAYTLSKNYRT